MQRCRGVVLPRHVQDIREAVEDYQGDEYVYLLRHMAAIVQCENWTFTADWVGVECALCCMVFGTGWSCSKWTFGVSMRQGNFLFENDELRGANLSDTIIFDPGVIRLAVTVFPDSD